MYIYKAAVIGAGVMGAEIAQVISYSGLPVLLKDIDEGIVEKGVNHARSIYQRRVDKGKMDAGTMREKMSLIEGVTTYDGFSDVDIVIEAVSEKIGLKRRIFAELDEACPSSAVLASNTSALSISELGAATKRPGKVIGMHFFNPASVMKLVEVIPGLDTADETVDDVIQFAEDLRKLPVRVRECAGFLVNRLLGPYLNEAALALQEGSAPAAEIDTKMVEFGMPMGPFVLTDMLGLDVAADVAMVLYNEYGERMRPAQVMGRLVAAGRLGDKSGKGIYSQEGGEELERAIAETQRETGVSGTPFSVDRMVMPLINEAVLCVQENIASVKDINLAMMAGTGMPKGPLELADEMGLDTVLEKLEKLHRLFGDRFLPAPLLRRYVRAGHVGRKSGRGFSSYAG